MKKFALLAGLFVFAPMTWAQDYNIKNGLPSETYITCAEANEMAKTDSAQVAEIVAVMGNASVASRDLKKDKLMTIAERLEQKGRQEGRMEGALEKALAIACQLQKMGMTPEQIKQATGLSDDELKKIIH